MIRKLFLLIIILTFFQGFSQTVRHVKGMIVSGEIAVASVDIINLNTKVNASSDKNGNFNIAATLNDVLYFISKGHEDVKIKISRSNLDENIIIHMESNAIELDEVKIEERLKIQNVGEYNDVKMYALEKSLTTPKVNGVYTGELVNAMDFIQIGKSIWKLFKGKKKKEISKDEEIDYQDFIASVFNEEFFTKSLQIKPDQINLFLDFCLADEKVLEVISKKNKFEMMDVLIIKNEEFKKIK